ncbi:MAG TPA: nicotinamide riboside transporter PnuC [Kofleriaceae bacterium]|nr:nicotinamide riboside transporter PnuC [Kofleriaceae bacterium]
MTGLEIAANGFNAAAILLAGRNSVHTWWTGIVGCALFGLLFLEVRLYADATLQLFSVGTSVYGWWAWLRGGPGGAALPIRRAGTRLMGWAFAAGAAVTLGYAWLLARFTDAVWPLPDSAVLAFSVLGQLLMMARRVESWWCWLAVNTIAVPLYASRGLAVTAVLYAGFWLNAIVALRHWRRQLEAAPA